MEMLIFFRKILRHLGEDQPRGGENKLNLTFTFGRGLRKCEKKNFLFRTIFLLQFFSPAKNKQQSDNDTKVIMIPCGLYFPQ